MDFSYLLASIFAESAGKTVDKFNYRHSRIQPRQMLVLDGRPTKQLAHLYPV